MRKHISKMKRLQSSDDKPDADDFCFLAYINKVGIEVVSSGHPLAEDCHLSSSYVASTYCQSHGESRTSVECNLLTYPGRVSEAPNKTHNYIRNRVSVVISCLGVCFHFLFPCERAVGISQLLAHTDVNGNGDVT